ncbi:MAG: pilus assembly protein, partial [Sneathiella sp.]|nr:pilus assembly protein [Sneathiella sp.]
MNFLKIKKIPDWCFCQIGEKGAVAIETAVCIPLLFLLMAMGAELVRYVNVADSVARATATTADLLAREDSIDAAKLEKYLRFGPKIIEEEGYGSQTDIALRSISRELDGTYT